MVGVATVHAVLMSLFIADLVLQQRSFLHQRHLLRGSSLVQGIAQQAVNGLLTGDIASLQEIVKGFSTYPELRYAAILDLSGRVVAHTASSRIAQYMTDHVTQDMLQGVRTSRVLVDDGDVVDLSAPVLVDGRLLGWVRFAAGMEGVNQQLRKVVFEGLMYAVAAIVLGVAFAFAMARGTARRLYELMKVAEATRDGQRDLRAAPDRVHEVGRLAASFNAMLDTLVQSEQLLRKANLELECKVEQRTAALAQSEEAQRAVLEQANDAFVSIDEEGTVVNWNRMAEVTFGWSRDEALGAPLETLIVPPEIRPFHQQWVRRYLAAGGESRLVDRRAELDGWRRDGSRFPVELSMRLRQRSDGKRFFDAFLRDITQRKALESQLEAQALEDSLTGLPNRRALLEALPLAMARSERSDRMMALLFIDLDGFKGINDRHGHEAGDEVLRQFGHRLKAAVRDCDIVARLGGDEFVVLAEGLLLRTHAQTVARKLQACSAEPFELAHGLRLPLSCSIGVCFYEPGAELSADDLLNRADDRMYAAKRAGQGRIEIHTAP